MDIAMSIQETVVKTVSTQTKNSQKLNSHQQILKIYNYILRIKTFLAIKIVIW